jgi:hypothetical protein
MEREKKTGTSATVLVFCLLSTLGEKGMSAAAEMLKPLSYSFDL